MRLTILFVSAAAILVLLMQPAGAAPSLPVTSPPVTPQVSWTGPPIDPDAKHGQWFTGLSGTGVEESRPLEFHDNVLSAPGGPGGGGAASFRAIYGVAQNIQFSPLNMAIVGFDIAATITNDTPAQSQWLEGTNSHGERTDDRPQYKGPLYDTKLTAEFAIDRPALNHWLVLGGAFVDPPYRDRQPYIQAENADQLGWYCWTPDNPQDELRPYGAYLVPTWDFGDIGEGMSKTEVLKFTVSGGGLAPADPRYQAIVQSAEENLDILSNRSTSLKISNWIDELSLDPAVAVPPVSPALLRSDCSVFHSPVPEPSTVVLLLGAGLTGLLAYVRCRRKRKA